MKTIEQYIDTEMSGKITRKRNSPLPGLLVLAVGIAMWVLLCTADLGDSLSATCLTVGLIATALGLILTAMNLSGALTHFVYLPTRSRMRRRKCYLSIGDYQHCLDAIGSGNIGALATLLPVTGSNEALDLLYSHDHAVALLQAIRDNSGHFEPETPVLRLTGTEVTHIQSLCK